MELPHDHRSSLRPVDLVLAPPPLHWVGDGFRVAGYMNVVPDAARRLSPFLLLDYHPPFVYPPAPRPRGVGVHPHRGFETVTVVWQGSVAHHDSTGAGGIIGPGDVQWMTAASGILHKEYHEAEFSRRGGLMHMAQLWVNLPRAHKMRAPGYQALDAAAMGSFEVAQHDTGANANADEPVNSHVRVRVIAGEYASARGPAHTYSPITMLDVSIEAGGNFHLPIDATHNLSILVMTGRVRINDSTDAAEGHFVVFANQGRRVMISASSRAHLLVLSGEPIDEPVVQYGPFAMTSREEIAQAFEDYQAGRFGTLAD